MNRIARLAIALAVVALFGFGCATQRSTTGQIQIKALIDGSDQIKLNGDELWYEHGTFDLPGQWQGRHEPTYINGVAWQPDWAGTVSEPYRISPPFASADIKRIKLVQNEGRGRVSISGMPTRENNYTLSILFDDRRTDEAAWYDVTVSW